MASVVWQANADEAPPAGGSTNFILIDYGINLSADGDETETLSLGTGDVASGETEPLLNDGIINDSSGFVGVGFGHRYANNIGAILRYETGEFDSGTLNIQIAPGSAFTAADASTMSTEVESFMVEGAYFIRYSEKVELWGLVGLAQFEITTANSSAKVTEGGTETSFTAMCERSEDNTATRFGVGATYYMNQTQGFYGGVMLTDYGDAKFNAVENGACTNRPDPLSVKDIESTDLRIGFFRIF